MAAWIATQFNGTATSLQRSSLYYLAVILLVLSLVTNLAAQLIVRRIQTPDGGARRDNGCSHVRSPVAPRGAPPQAHRQGDGNRLHAGGRGGRRSCCVLVIYAVARRGLPALSTTFFTAVPSTDAFGNTDRRRSPTRSSARSSSPPSRPPIAVPVGVLIAIFNTEFASPKAADDDQAAAERAGRNPDGRDRRVHLRAACGRQRLQRVRRLGRAVDCDGAGDRPVDRGGACAGARTPARGRAWPWVQVARAPPSRSSCRRLWAGSSTATILAVARAAGETAPLLFTSSIFANAVTTDPRRPMGSLPLTIYFDSEQPSQYAQQQAWAAALVLMAVVLIASIAGRLLSLRSRRQIERAR